MKSMMSHASKLIVSLVFYEQVQFKIGFYHGDLTKVPNGDDDAFDGEYRDLCQ